MSPFAACVSAPSTFSVMHPLHCGPTAFRQQEPSNMTIDTFATTATVCQSLLASPTATYSKNRADPVTSPSKKIRKSRVVFDFTTDEMAKYFHMSQREAAQQLGVATVTVKRNCRRLGIVWPYRLMKSKKNAINWSAISREDAQRIRQERALERAKAGRSPSSRSRSTSRSSIADDDEVAAKAMTMLSHSSSVELTEAGRAFARLPLDCMDMSD
ncbi:putative extracellular protein [Phytophthora megakarya]|uniref:Putative extracellular protein n=1 Tax=Phytophthora megakarya TaxID=4795 RepID=A0A225WPM6_9STRA|nr:putative extracellular protein [Phytophthora megakarya]